MLKLKKKSSYLFFLTALIVIGVLVLIFFQQQFVPRSRQKITKDFTREKIKVVASFYPIAEFVRKVGGDFVTVSTITPPGMEPHDFEPTPRQIASVYESDLLAFNGGGVDAWAKRLAPSVQGSGVHTFEAASALQTLLPSRNAEEHEAFDPHFWLNPVLAQRQVEAIRNELSKIDPAHAEVFLQNAEIYTKTLRDLDVEFKTSLTSCKLHTVITSHAAFAYLAEQYGFTQLSISGISPDEEPSAGKLAEIAVQAKKQGVKYIFFETLVNPGLAKTLAREVGAQILVFNPLEGLTSEEISAGKDYISVMKENLLNLRIAMMCTSS